MRGALRRGQGVNLPPGLTVTTVELVDGVVALLKTTKGLVESVELGLARATVMAS